MTVYNLLSKKIPLNFGLIVSKEVGGWVVWGQKNAFLLIFRTSIYADLGGWVDPKKDKNVLT